jgi:sec-independent protein translocase protein TatA
MYQLAFGLGTQELLLLLLILLLLFGGSRLPQLASGLGKSIRSFKRGMADDGDEAELEEARRREQLRAGSEGAKGETLTSGKLTADKQR